MKKIFHPFWTIFTIVLTLIFIILLPLSIISRYGPFKTAIFTLIGVAVIWIVYFVRTLIFTSYSSEDKKNSKTER